MKVVSKLFWLIIVLCLPALESLSQKTVPSGLPIGAESPAFGPQHAWGPDKGSHACPMCKYGYNPGVMVFLNSDADLENTRRIVTKLEEESVRRKSKRFKAFLIYTNPNRRSAAYMDSMLSSIGKELKIQHVALTYVPSVDDRETEMNKNKINPRTTNTVIVYNKRRVKAKFTNFVYDAQNVKVLLQAVDQAGL